MKKRLTDERNQTVTMRNASKMTPADGKQRRTDVVDAEQLWRPIQSIVFFEALFRAADLRASILAKATKGGDAHA